MVQKKLKHTDQEWLDTIMECRSSGLTDKAWCEAHQISRSNFYYHIRRLRKQACEIPGPSLNQIPLRQEVVPVEIRDESMAAVSPSFGADQPFHVNNTHAGTAVCIRFGDIQVEILNGADGDVIRNALSAVCNIC